MSNLATGYLPTGAIGAELSAITRRAFIPSLIVQVYNASPNMAALIANANTATGGINSVTAPVQGNAMTTPAWSDYSGTFNQPAVQTGIQDAEFSLKLLITPIPYLGMEGLVQADHAVINRLYAVMNDAGNSTTDTLSTALFTNVSNTQQMTGFPAAIDDGTNLVTYGGISRTTYSWWQSLVYANSPAVNPTRASVMQWITGTVKKCGELPTYGTMGPGTWQLLANDYVGQESYVIQPGRSFTDDNSGPRSAFRALEVAGVPIYLDPYQTEGELLLINSNYINLYIHEMASFAFTGFESTLPNFQLGYVGAVVTVLELVNVKPKSCTRVSGLNYLSI